MEKNKVVKYILQITLVASLLVLVLLVSGFVSNVIVETYFLIGAVLAVVVVFLILERVVLRTRIYGPDRSFKYHDPSVLIRAVYHKSSGEERLIRNIAGVSYRDAIAANWPFTEVNSESNWIVTDSNGNDISEVPINQYDGMAYIVEVSQHA